MIGCLDESTNQNRSLSPPVIGADRKSSSAQLSSTHRKSADIFIENQLDISTGQSQPKPALFGVAIHQN